MPGENSLEQGLGFYIFQEFLGRLVRMLLNRPVCKHSIRRSQRRRSSVSGIPVNVKKSFKHIFQARKFVHLVKYDTALILAAFPIGKRHLKPRPHHLRVVLHQNPLGHRTKNILHPARRQCSLSRLTRTRQKSHLPQGGKMFILQYFIYPFHGNASSKTGS